MSRLGGLVAATMGVVALVAAGPSVGRAADLANAREGTRWITLGVHAGPVVGSSAQPANALIVNGEVYVVDAGNGVAGQLFKAGINPAVVSSIFISHNHNDHNADMGTLMGVEYSSGRVAPITVYGPAGTEAAMKGFMEFFRVNADIRMSEADHQVPPEAVFFAKDVSAPGVVYRDRNITVTAVENDHFHFAAGSPAHGRARSYAYRFQTPDRVIVYTGDTGPSARVVELAKGADLLISEVINVPELIAYFTKNPPTPANARGSKGSGPKLQDVLRHFNEDHLSPEDVGRMASAAGVKSVLLTHLAPEVPEQDLERVYLAPIRKFYSGPVAVAHDLGNY